MTKFSIVIRVKNEQKSLALLLKVLSVFYIDYIEEIIIVDNNSTDGSYELAIEHKCKVVSLKEFTYGKAINMGINASITNHIVLLSAHSLPIGASFFKSLSLQIDQNPKIGAARFINSGLNYERSLINDFEVKAPLKFGLTASCAYVNKLAWQDCRFDENIIACEDKLWSQKIIEIGYIIIEIPETYFYIIQRTTHSALNRMRNEEIASHLINNTRPISISKAFLIFVKNISLGLLINSWDYISYHFLKFRSQIFINKYLN